MSTTEAATTPHGGNLNSTLLFRGRTVITRQRATYVHPNPTVQTPATSTIVDLVLLDDGSEVLQCRICGDTTWSTVRSAVSHAGAHSRKSAPTEIVEQVIAEERHEVRSSSRRRTVVASSDPQQRVVQDQLESVRSQLSKLQLGVNECLTRLRSLEKTQRVATRGEKNPSAAEYAAVREKARKYDELQNLLS